MSNDRKLRRSTDDKVIAGVCSGIADFFDLDTTLVRVVFAVLAVFGGMSIPVYLVMWLVVPASGHDRTVANDIIETTSSGNEDE